MLAIALLYSATAIADSSFPFEDDDPLIPTHFVSVQTGVNFGLIELGLQSGHIVASVSGNAGWAISTDARFVVVDVRLGYTWALSPPDETMWFFDLVADVLPGRMARGPITGPFADPHLGVFCGVGMSLGFRYVHRSGLVLGFRLPLAGMGFGDWVNANPGGFNGWDGVLDWYMAMGLSTSIFTLGLRF